MKHSAFVATFVAVTALVGCSGGTYTAPVYTGGPVISAPGGGSTLTLSSAVPSSTITVSEPGYAGTFTATSSNAAVAVVSAGSSSSAARTRAKVQDTNTTASSFTIRAVGDGSAKITFKDQNGRSSILAVTVANFETTSPVASPSSLQFTAVGQTAPIAVTESGYTGSFSAASSDTSVATVSPSSGSGSFTVTAIGSGTATLTFTDSDGVSVTAAVGVTTTGVTVNSRRRTP